MLVFSSEETGNNGNYRNFLCKVNILNGKTNKIIEKVEDRQICGVKVSTLEQYFVMLYKDLAPEIWDLTTCSLIKVMNAFQSVAGFEWAMSAKKRDSVSLFVFLIRLGCLSWVLLFYDS